MIGGQRQEENPDAETEIEDETSIDTGLIGDDNEDDVEVILKVTAKQIRDRSIFSSDFPN